MGYRSNVVIAIHKTIIARNLVTFEIPTNITNNFVKESEKAHYFLLEQWKWYDGCLDVKEIEDYFTHLNEESDYEIYGAVRMGEDLGDVESWGSPNDFDIYAVQDIQY